MVREQPVVRIEKDSWEKRDARGSKEGRRL